MVFQSIDGSCHCGNIQFVLQWPKSQTVIPVRKCGCDFCTRHGGAWTSHPDSELQVKANDPASVSKYEFGTKTAEFIICTTCGVVPLVMSEIASNLYAVVNVNTFADVGALTLSRSSTNFDGEDVGSRLERRKRNWVSHVQAQLDEQMSPSK